MSTMSTVHDLSKENVPIEASDEQHRGDRILAEPSKCGSLAPPHAGPTNNDLGVADEPAEPRASIETLCSLDISDNIPKIVEPMDAEDSPWGGRRQLLTSEFTSQ